MAVKLGSKYLRLAFFEARLFWLGRASRKDLAEYLEISLERASAAIREYVQLAPDNAHYDPSGKVYRPTRDFKPVIINPSPDQVLGHLLLEDGFLDPMPEMLHLPVPHRSIPMDILRVLLSTIAEGQSLKINYLSMSRPEPMWRWISPHAFGTDGYRWHVRAFCHRDEGFKDFVLGRIVETAERGEPLATSAQDTNWRETIELRIAPDPRLDDGPRAAIERDFCMKNGEAVFTVRKAMSWYVAKQWNLDAAPFNEPRRQQIVLLNPEVLE